MKYNEQRDNEYKKAKAFAEASKEKLAIGFKFVTENIGVATEEAKKMANMSDVQLEEYLKNNSKAILDKIVDAANKFSGKLKDNADIFPYLDKDAEKADNIIMLIKAILDEDKLSGWGNYSEIQSALRIWILKVFYTSYKKPSLLGTIVEFLTLPYVIAGVTASDGIATHMEKKKLQAAAIPSEKTHITMRPNSKYTNHCWNCNQHITEKNERCIACGWFKCASCGKCAMSCTGYVVAKPYDDLPFDTATVAQDSTNSYDRHFDYDPSKEPKSDGYYSLLEEHNYDEDSFESSPEYWEDLYNN